MRAFFRSAAVVAAALVTSADAFWRMDCHSRIALARLDPLVDGGVVSDHAHVIHGGSNFGMTTTYADLMESECTSCLVTQDKSAYWTPSLHFMYTNGTTVVVPQVGGMLAYYLLFGKNIKAFPKGFRMLSGDTRQRNFTLPVPDPPKSEWSGVQASQQALAQKALGFNCLDYSKSPEGSLYRHFLPDKAYLDANCPDGVRFELMFQSCWDGINLDSPDHKSHVAYSSLVMDGDCPKGFETRIPSLFYETIWNTAAFKGQAGEFVIANGDPTGCGYHGDFIAGWDVDLLQRAVNTCTNPSGLISDCPVFNLQSQAEGAKCKIENLPAEIANENCAGPNQGLCGNVPIQSGPAYASPLNGAGSGNGPAPPPTSASTSTSKVASSASSTVVTSSPSPVASSASSSSTPAPTPSTTSFSATPVVPTLSYSEGTHLATDAYGGGITIAAVNLSSDPPSPSVTAPAVMAEGALPENERILGTSVYTSAGAVYELVIVEEDVTVTADGPAPTSPTSSSVPARRRRRSEHLHNHVRRHGIR